MNIGKNRWILGLAGSHNGAAALIRDGEVVVAIQAERLTHNKRCPIHLDNLLSSAAARSIEYCLRTAGIDLPDLSAIAVSSPWRAITPRFGQFSTVQSPPFITVPHHLAHAEYALHYSSGRDCVVVICDGSGTLESDRKHLDIQEVEDAPLKYFDGERKESISAYHYRNGKLGLIYRHACDGNASKHSGTDGLDVPLSDSVGHLWRWAAHYCHGDLNDAGKVMGLSAFGDPSVHANLDTLRLSSEGKVEIDIATLRKRFQSPNLDGRDISGEQHYADIAAHVQSVTTNFLDDLMNFLMRRAGQNVICFAGGVALNGVANDQLSRCSDAKYFINGSCEDNGTAIGAAIAAHHRLFGERRFTISQEFYGRSYSSDAILEALSSYELRVRKLPVVEQSQLVASELANGKVVGWFQGRSEFGPRALGNRSILADPRNPNIQDTLNRKVKFREAFRPYAPVAHEHRADEFFQIIEPSPMMMRVVPVRSSKLPGVTHIDKTARLQTVNRKSNERLYDLIKCFDTITGVPVLLNTSFNLAGEPIVETPTDALNTFQSSAIDLLAIGDYIVER